MIVDLAGSSGHLPAMYPRFPDFCLSIVSLQLSEEQVSQYIQY
jgi:hypothetical protein